MGKNQFCLKYFYLSLLSVTLNDYLLLPIKLFPITFLMMLIGIIVALYLFSKKKKNVGDSNLKCSEGPKIAFYLFTLAYIFIPTISVRMMLFMIWAFWDDYLDSKLWAMFEHTPSFRRIVLFSSIPIILIVLWHGSMNSSINTTYGS